ncbi:MULTISPECIES: DHA2 family efflux MFS transporter permease subunit [Sphingobacterium]|jgi:DHA2 family multidrug resistance protein|uniref:DHA2 family efflux MFS transporter permease subunit n=1 Tax=Sphingobacterium TaxID=28453 RepID=UPI0004E5F7D3|nr:MULTISPECIES: DHA2 family efflux MFS transporter permease subunit [Sphingobacterium]CDS94375.1 EmrB/QacA family drug resistance transporter [Sphingobacterium sp. PM2-P1-29]SJN52357.1 Inner membrane component of tripartite multidrug resistance system [Sphingobacterium faecium PCAi_F2.5]HCU46799.1 MFS transporter [Sphingobacterium sp.]UPZ36221.1 DHA2 family efflux MFS transporter permease subunit [Sphingobacterium sp. PCS056]UXD67791.1 DHA2 family efflux MFS transporter permease subunit [Sphi
MTATLDQDSLIEYGYRRVIITIIAVLCALLEIVDTTIVNVALNDMKGTLGATLTDIAWVITAYAIANVIVIPMTSWLSQQFGRKNYFAASIIIFTVASFLCGNSTNIWELVFFRFIQGMGGGALLVTAQTIITESYPPAKRSMAQAIYGMGVIVGPTLGPPLGGYIVDHFSWPYIFYINVPLGIIAVLLTLSFVKSPKYGEKQAAKDVDWWGMIFLIMFIGSLQYVLEHGQQDDWFSNRTIVVLSITSVLGLLFFVWRELTYDRPIVNLRVLKDKNLQVGVVMSFILGFGLFGSTFVIPIYTQSILGWTATDAGLLLIPSSLMTGFMMPFIGKMIQNGVPQKYMVALGLCVFFGFSFVMYSRLTNDTGAEHMFWPLIFRGVGLGLLFVPVMTLSLSTLSGKSIGEGAAFTGMMRQLGGSFGIALITTFISRFTQSHRVNLIAHLDPTNFEVQQRINQLQASFVAKGFTPNEALAKAYQLLEGSVMKQATVLSYMDVFLYIGLLFIVCVPFVLMIKQGKNKVDTSSLH